MTRILSKSQEQAVFQNIPANFTIETVAFNNVSKLYINQMTKEHSAYPVIALNFSQSGLASDIRDISAGAIYYKTMLTIHILAKHYVGPPYVNGALIAKGIAKGIMDSVKTWTTSITGDVRIFDPDEDIRALENKGQVPEWGGAFDYVFWINLSHS